MKRRRFISGVPSHCYQRALDGDIIFYSVSDYLSCFTYMCVSAVRNMIKLRAVAYMPEHLHLNAEARRVESLDLFMKEFTSPFAVQHNRVCGEKGPLFHKSYGSAPKQGEKALRTNLLYIINNPVERHLCTHAEDYRWNFLAYSESTHPFSEKLRLDWASSAMRRAVAEVKAAHRHLLPLNYQTLQRLFSPLNDTERQQLADFIIVTYNVIDYRDAGSHFGTLDEMLRLSRSSSGSEYDIKEDFAGWSDMHYSRMTKIVMEKYALEDIHDMLKFPDSLKLDAARFLRTKTDATDRQIHKFLHLHHGA